MATFDLLDRSVEGAKGLAGFRAIMTIGGIALALLCLLIVLFNAARGSLPANFASSFGVPYIGLPSVVGLCVIAVWKAGPGAVSVEVDREGLAFRWPSGKVDRALWDQPAFRLSLRDWSGHPALPKLTRLLWEARRWDRPSTELSREAFDAIVRAAEEHGLEIERKLNASSMLKGCISVEIRGRIQAQAG